MHGGEEAIAIIAILCFIATVLIAAIIVKIFFCLSLYKAMKKVPEGKRKFPAWFCWMILVPLVNIVFSWIMIPFGIPGSFKNHLSKNKVAKQKAQTLFNVGLAYMILLTMLFIPFVNLLAAIPALVLFIVYWVQIVSFKNEFL